MIKYYLIPTKTYMENGELSRTAKYLEDMGINWSGSYIKSKDVYVVCVNTDAAKHTQLKAFLDVIELDGKKATKDKIKNILKLTGGIPITTDEVDFIGKMENPDFTKDKLWVSE